MAKWLNLPAEKLFYQPHQDAFLQARRMRSCPVCKILFKVPPQVGCPKCGIRGVRKFDRLTIIAGRRFGKSRFGSIAGVEEACVPNTIGWACAPTNPKLHRYVIPAFQQLIPNEWVEDWNSEFKDLRLKNGSLIHFQTLEDPDQGRGQGLDWLWIDEACELTKLHWDTIRPSLIDRQGVAFITTSPQGYDWVYKELYKPAENQTQGYWGCRAKTKDNPTISEEFLAREKSQMSDEMYRQEYEADFVIFEGAVYGSFEGQILRTDDHIRQIIPEWPEIDKSRPVIVGIDTGADHPFGGVKIVSTENGLVVCGEYLERHKSFVEHAGALKRLAGGHSSIRWAINRNERQPMIEFAQHGIYPSAAENDVVAGTERVKTWLHNKQLYFLEYLCPKTIEQMRAYRWAPLTTKDEQLKGKEKVFKKDDELPDCVRYALMTWPQLPQPRVVQKPIRDISTLPDEMQATIIRNRRIDKEPKLEPQDVVGDFYL